MNPLTPEEKRVIIDKGTEAPFTGEYVNTKETGVYVCRQCGEPLYSSKDKFESDCGWPSFDDEIPGAVHKSLDADGIRTEITCANCGAHLGHLFIGEHLTEKNKRYCVNSISMKFIPGSSSASMDGALHDFAKSKKIILAGGCFWGLQELIRKQPGVVTSRVGYTGGRVENPTYENHEGHAEAVEIEYDTEKTSYKNLLDFFFQIHNPTTLNQQGNDMGTSYRSAIFYGNEEEKKEAKDFIDIVNKSKRWKDPVVTTLESLKKFYPAEEYHQNYLQKNPKGYTCHRIYFKSYL
jgi:peptide methionine sulfoxide reductase msrA/msrB